MKGMLRSFAFTTLHSEFYTLHFKKEVHLSMKFVSNPFGEAYYVAPQPLQQTDSPPTAISKLPDFQTPALNPEYEFSKQLQQLLNGRKLLLQEISTPIEEIHDHYQNGFISYHKGISEKDRTYFCERCGNNKRHLFASHHCSRCDEECVYCRHCITMGKVSQCSPLLTWSGPQILYEKSERCLQWQGTLSPGQQVASEKIVIAVRGIDQNALTPETPSVSNTEQFSIQRSIHKITTAVKELIIPSEQAPLSTSKSKLLIWAVCGAGKTEILFEGMNKAIEQGQTVLIATPRSDVVHELTPRIKAVFPKISVLSLFGGSEDRGKEGQLVIATTHQLLRYENHFDFVVIDEVDAFPFSYDSMLKYAAEKAAKRNATKILLTATPDKKLQNAPDIDIVKIPKRYHGFPLPVPRSEWSGNWRKLLKKNLIPTKIIEWLKKREATNQQAFLFIPSVAVLNQLVPILKKQFHSLDGVHSEDPNRREKVQNFRNKDIQLLVTTTILERGVTVPNIAVAVYGADDDVFTESALVQISGRVGRSAEHPTGDIVFFHYGKTEAMLDAIDHIKLMNKLGGF